MIRSNFVPLGLAIALLAGWQPGWAMPSNMTITDGQGEGVQVKHGFFGHKSTKVQDRLGDGFIQKNGWFGTKETGASILGNEFKSKKGLFGVKDVEGHDMLGDSITTKKGLLGFRTTRVNLNGASKFLDDMLGNKKGYSAAGATGFQPVNPSAANVPGPSPSANPLDRDVLTNP